MEKITDKRLIDFFFKKVDNNSHFYISCVASSNDRFLILETPKERLERIIEFKKLKKP
jgi:hypothetical protein